MTTENAQKSLFPRSSGVLLHPTSLPGRYGIGDLGEYAYRFVDWLVDTGQTIWQVLPLGPTGYADSPYQCLSAFAGNTNLISIDILVGEGWLSDADRQNVPPFPEDHVDYGWILPYHKDMLHRAYGNFKVNTRPERRAAFEAWCRDNADWLNDWVLFIALKEERDLRPWTEWEPDLALRKPAAIQAARERLADKLQEHQFLQWVFAEQWGNLRHYANERQVRLVGDLPIFVAHDSSDVWANPDKFYLDKKGNPEVIAGVPPDYFSPTGQRWGNPLYRWDKMAATGYNWWIKRIQGILKQVDLIRIDHFRGFEAYWEIPATEETAVKGKWIKGPNIRFFEALRDQLGELPIIAEDLGEITKEVVELRDSLGLPGMKILQFAWSEPTNPFLPHNHVPHCVVYSGTHDNNTTVGWWNDPKEVTDKTRAFMFDYIGHDTVTEINWSMIKLGMRSPANTFVMPMQDVLGLGAEARMNTPGQPSGNWTWRLTVQQLFDPLPKDRLTHVTRLYQRRPDQQEVKYGDVAVQDRE
ncbi:MAG TPA: 4-alpha-glucanotransferase [Aggregatilineaceae bacterium]|nr:4-alpha-glucanotransferase [Aggregatilineaceae bacterium]